MDRTGNMYMDGKLFSGLENSAASRSRLYILPAAVLASLSLLFFCVRAYHGVWFLPFVDEAEHLLGGITLGHGAKLYSSFVDAHGPVIYMATQAYGALFGWSHPNGARFITIVLTFCVACCVGTSPALVTVTARLNAASLFLGLLASVWLLQALYMVNYHAVAGLLNGVAIALLLAPLWLGGPVRQWQAFVAGACLLLVAATAYSFAPTVCMLGLSAVWCCIRSGSRATARSLAMGGLVAAAVVVAWLLAFGDLKGYIVYHFLFNQFVFSKYLPFSLANFFASLVPSIQPVALVHCLALLSWASSCAFVLVLDRVRTTRSPSMAGPIVVGFVGLLALCARGGTLFQEGSFLVSTIVTVSIAAAAFWAQIGGGQRSTPQLAFQLVGAGLFGACIMLVEVSMRHALDSPWGMTRQQMVSQPRYDLGPSNAPLSARIRALTSINDRLLALPFAPDLYLSSGRLPMNGYNYYLPWDADYGKAPWLGIQHNLCSDLERTPPKLIVFNNWIVWGSYAMADYAPCVISTLSSRYERQHDFPDLYVRRAPAR